MKTASRIPALPNNSYFAMNRWFYKMHQTRLLYNPDDSAAEIVSISTGEPLFTPDECVELDNTVALMFELHGDKVYDVCLHYAQKPVMAKLTSV
jgi:hypothetical protein